MYLKKRTSLNMNTSISAYYHLAKPGIIYGNLLMYAAGFFLASSRGIDWPLFLAGLSGLALVIGGACVFNNIADRAMDAKMERTKARATVSGKISIQNATRFGYALTLLGFFELYFLTSYLAFLSALIGFAVYVFVYTRMKPHSRNALFVGAVAGAMPPVVGYTAVTGEYDLWALGLFVALFLWQLPHFLSISFKRYEEYAAAGVPLFLHRGPKTDKEKKTADRVFVGSLILLLLSCLAVALWRLLLA